MVRKVEGSAQPAQAVGVHGFPVVLTSFVGRAGAVREVADLLAEYRLVTVRPDPQTDSGAAKRAR
jgi:hypothetical protein